MPRLLWLVLAAALTGCVSFTTGFGADAALNGAPKRGMSGHIEGGTFFHIKNKVIVEPQVAGLAAPLENSAYVIAYGGRVSIRNQGKRPGFFVGGWYGNQLGERKRPEGVGGSAFKTTAGVIWSIHEPNKTVPSLSNGFLAMSAGLTYHHHEQDNLGSGDFLGVELSFTFGLNWPLGLYVAFRDWKPSKD